MIGYSPDDAVAHASSTATSRRTIRACMAISSTSAISRSCPCWAVWPVSSSNIVSLEQSGRLNNENRRTGNSYRSRCRRRMWAAFTGSSSSFRADCGIEGVGEIYSATFHPKAMTPVIEDVFERYLLGHDPGIISKRFYRECYSATAYAAPRSHDDGRRQRPRRRHAGTSSARRRRTSQSTSCSAAACTSVCVRTPIYPGRTSRGEYDYDDPDLAAECAAHNVELGFTAVKFDPAYPYTAYSDIRFRSK